MFNAGSRPTITNLMVDLADSGLELAECSDILKPILRKSMCGYGPLTRYIEYFQENK